MKTKPWPQTMVTPMVKFHRDQRHIAHYRSYHVAKFLGIVGSVIICIGLLSWFLHDHQSKLAITVSITAFGVLLFLVAAGSFFKSAYHTIMEQRKHDGIRQQQATATSSLSSLENINNGMGTSQPTR